MCTRLPSSYSVIWEESSEILTCFSKMKTLMKGKLRYLKNFKIRFDRFALHYIKPLIIIKCLTYFALSSYTPAVGTHTVQWPATLTSEIHHFTILFALVMILQTEYHTIYWTRTMIRGNGRTSKKFQILRNLSSRGTINGSKEKK